MTSTTTTTTTTARSNNIIELFGGAMTCELPSSSSSKSESSESSSSKSTTELVEWRDISDVRQIPDHQECYQSSEGRVLVIEILDYQSTISNEDAAKYFFDDLAESNNNNNNGSPLSTTRDNKFQTTTPLLNIIKGESQEKFGITNAVICSGIGYQKAVSSKSNKGYKINGIEGNNGGGEEEEIHSIIQVELCVFRLANISTDILVTMSKPMKMASSTTTTTNNNEATAKEKEEMTTTTTTATTTTQTVAAEAAAAGGEVVVSSSYFQHVVSTLTIHDWGLFG